jgi:hypothetical protein
MLKPVALPPGRARLATRPRSTGLLTPVKTIGIVDVAFFAASAEGVLPLAMIKSNLSADEIGSQCRQAIVMSLCPTVFDHDVLALDVAGFSESLMKGIH